MNSNIGTALLSIVFDLLLNCCSHLIIYLIQHTTAHTYALSCPQTHHHPPSPVQYLHQLGRHNVPDLVWPQRSLHRPISLYPHLMGHMEALYTHAHIITHMHTHMHIHTNTHAHTHAHIITHMHTHAHMHTHTCTHTHAHTHTQTHRQFFHVSESHALPQVHYIDTCKSSKVHKLGYYWKFRPLHSYINNMYCMYACST